ncbi:MAG: hypothetical protein LIO40_00030 [Ruminococcus sp.]|nr:hypothetical protein [Ruminococcus sp.]
MVLIKGIDIELYSGSETEIVSNVLVGEPSTIGTGEMSDGKMLAYTLGIPKGDEHQWTDRIVGFFGRKFRTVGLPEEGIEENIPLIWHKKVKVELLQINGSCTLYEKNTFERHFFENVYICDNRGKTADKTGEHTADELKLIIYGAVGEQPDYAPNMGDIVIDCECPLEFDTTSQQTVSESMAQLRQDYPDLAVVRSVVRRTSGTLPDYEISAR